MCLLLCQRFAAACLLLVSPCLTAQAQETGLHGDRGRLTESGGPRQPRPAFTPTVAADTILGRPTATSVVLSLLRYDHDGAVVLAYGPEAQVKPRLIALDLLVKDSPVEVALTKLTPASRYQYQLRDKVTNQVLVAGRFVTQPALGTGFRFTVSADSHLDQNTELALYRQTLANVARDAPDFHIDLGDTFMSGKHMDRDNATQQYRAQRAYFGTVGNTVPLFLVIGNHDGEEARQRRGGAGSLAVWSNAMRKRYFPNPLEDDFYTANISRDGLAGTLQDYYAWQWGDALFIVLDPYWYAADRRSEERWDLSLGEAQYRWLQRTLEQSRAKYKLVFVHQLVGGIDRHGRGGIEGAGFGEWGGRNADGSDGFAAHRPGWELPIHDLLRRHQVSAVFHGHDHLYARQELDGIVYQEVPQPGHPGTEIPRFAAEYGYRQGVILGGSGHLRVTVGAAGLVVDFVQVGPVDDSAQVNRQIVHSYAIP